VLIVGHHKGSGGDTKQKVYRNFGYAKPEGYRKALRAMKLAEKFRRPVIAFIDTPAAYPGVESEERGISEAIAFNLREMAALDTPIVIVVHGEGGSGGALGHRIGDRILMHEFAIYSVIPPEGCAAILWRDSKRKVGGRRGAQAHGARICSDSESSTRSSPSPPAARIPTTSCAGAARLRARARADVGLADGSATRLDARYQKFRRWAM
jgi:acetyl-CoA carboxylase carboxyl transferase subunit alpha